MKVNAVLVNVITILYIQVNVRSLISICNQLYFCLPFSLLALRGDIKTQNIITVMLWLRNYTYRSEDTQRTVSGATAIQPACTLCISWRKILPPAHSWAASLWLPLAVEWFCRCFVLLQAAASHGIHAAWIPLWGSSHCLQVGKSPAQFPLKTLLPH